MLSREAAAKRAPSEAKYESIALSELRVIG
jgi:hypothetical protein